MVKVNKSYEEIIQDFITACSQHVGIASFDTGTIDFLDASSVNRMYPYIFLRPVTSPGLVNRTRTITFELFSLDVPKLSNESPVQLMSLTEQYLYDIISWFNEGPGDQTYDITISSISPVNEAFQDRAFGWVAVINVTVPYVFDYCNFPKL